MKGRGRRERKKQRERRTKFVVVAFFAIVNPLEMEISYINIIPSNEANCFIS